MKSDFLPQNKEKVFLSFEKVSAIKTFPHDLAKILNCFERNFFISQIQ